MVLSIIQLNALLATLLDCTPCRLRHSYEHVDAGIVPSGRGIAGHGERRLGRGRTSWLDPGRTAGFQLGNDLVSDVVIEACSA